jgi:AcrR family transcriptional regulator
VSVPELRRRAAGSPEDLGCDASRSAMQPSVGGRTVWRRGWVNHACSSGPLSKTRVQCADKAAVGVIVENMRVQAGATTSDRLLGAAAELLREGGVGAVSTRAVAAAAGTQPPILYRHFGDKEGLLEAVALHVLEEYIAKKRKLLRHSDDPVDDLRRLWDLFVAFGFSQPECFALIYGTPRHGDAISAAAETTVTLLGNAIARIADIGRLRMSVDRATALFQSCGVGFVITQLTNPAAKRNRELSDIARENALDSIMVTSGTSRTPKTLAGRATALRQAIGEDDVPLTPAELHLMTEWLDRIADKRRR